MIPWGFIKKVWCALSLHPPFSPDLTSFPLPVRESQFAPFPSSYHLFPVIHSLSCFIPPPLQGFSYFPGSCVFAWLYAHIGRFLAKKFRWDFSFRNVTYFKCSCSWRAEILRFIILSNLSHQASSQTSMKMF